MREEGELVKVALQFKGEEGEEVLIRRKQESFIGRPFVFENRSKENIPNNANGSIGANKDVFEIYASPKFADIRRSLQAFPISEDGINVINEVFDGFFSKLVGCAKNFIIFRLLHFVGLEHIFH